MLRWAVVLGVLLFVTFNKCTSLNGLADGDGGGTRTGNPAIVTGAVVDSLGLPVAGALVTVRSTDYVSNQFTSAKKSGDRYSTSTNDSGRFVIDSLSSGSYFIEVNDLVSSAVLLQCNVFGLDTVADLGTDTLAGYAAIKGIVPDISANKVYHALIYGLERTVLLDTAGEFGFYDIPSGVYTISIVCSDTLVKALSFDNIAVQSGAVAGLDVSGWQFSEKLFLNTGLTGASVMDNVLDFPVLIRLHSANFDFSESLPQGDDLRFQKADGTILNHEIEMWDAFSEKADIWVQVDTVHGNNSTQFIVMYWGNTQSSNNSGSNKVFDVNKGFLGAWHLDSTCSDATVNGLDGTSYGTAETAGIIGYARSLGRNEYIEIPGLMGRPPTVTLSAWARLDSADRNGAEVISIGDAVLLRMDDTLVDFGTQGSFCIDTTYTEELTMHDEVYSGLFLEKTGWHYLVYVIDSSGSKQSLYIDGELAGSKNNPLPVNYVGLGSSTFIGRHGNGQPGYGFTGLIDEVRICGVARSDAWVKLCYVNQKSEDALVKR